MKLQQSNTNADNNPSNSISAQTESDVSYLQSRTTVAASKLPEPTFGQKLADKMASKVGSWGFLIGQTSVLTVWVGCNLVPGVPHWDQSPFILLNLVFSFASAYTAPVVLMSQNRQSDEDRAHAMQNHQINLQTAENLELLHQKMDAMYSQKLAQLTELIQQTAKPEATNKPITPIAPLPSPNYIGLLPSTTAQSKQSYVLPMVDVDLFAQVTAAKPENLVEDLSSEHN